MSAKAARAVRAAAPVLLAPLLLAASLSGAVRDPRAAQRGLVSMLGGDEHSARAARHFIDEHPAEAFATLLDCMGERPRDAGRCARWLPLAVRTPEDRARAVAALAALLDAPPEPPDVRRSAEIQAIGAAGEIGPDARSLVPRIAALLAARRASGAHDQELLAIARALARIEPEHPELVPTLEALLFAQDDRWQRRNAIAVLASLGDAGRAAVPPLRRALGDGDPEIVATAVRGLGMLGPVAAPALPDLAARLAALCPEAAASSQRECDDLLDAIGRIEASAFPTLLRLLESPAPETRWRALSAFRRLGATARPARAAIERALASDYDASVRAAAATALGGLADPASVPALVTALRGRDLRASALSALGAIGPGASAAREPIERLLLASPADAAPAAGALARIGDPASVPALLAAATNRKTRAPALKALEDLGPHAAAARDPLLAMLASDPDLMARRQAAQTLGALCDPATVPALTAALADPLVRPAAVSAIGRLGPRARSAREAVANAGADESQRLALARIDGAAPAPCDPETASGP